MRLILLRTLGIAGLAAGVSRLGAPARAGDVVAPIPFSFEVDGHALAPGSYHVSLRAPNGVLFIRALDGVFTMANPGETDDDVTEPRLVFLKLDDRYYLKEAWLGGNRGWTLAKPEIDEEALPGRRVASQYVVIPAAFE
jgi:hypothetical protein